MLCYGNGWRPEGTAAGARMSAHWLFIVLAQQWWRGHPFARLVVAFLLLCGLCDLLLGKCQITSATPQIEKALDLAILLACAVLAWMLSGGPAYWRTWRAWRNRRPWYADFYENYTDRLR